MKNKKNISVLGSFTEYPGLRHCKISDDSGEEFYHKVLNKEFKKALDNNEILIINLDNTAGYAPSFLDEAFGNLVYDFSMETVEKNIEIISEQEPSWKDMIYKETFVQWEDRRKKNETPKITGNHSEWYRLNTDNELEYKVWN